VRKVCTAWEFRHDQMPAFVAASALVKDKPNFDQLIRFIDDGRALALPVGDQATLLEFIAALSVRDGDLVSLRTDAREDANPFGKPERPGLVAMDRAVRLAVAGRGQRQVRQTRPRGGGDGRA
jgi:hypothetical protein